MDSPLEGAGFEPSVRFPPENEVRSGLIAGGESQERTRLRKLGLFRAILDGNELVLAQKITKNRNPGS